MAKQVKFPLEMANGVKVTTLDDLRKHFDLASILQYYDDGRLGAWLNHRRYFDEADKINALDSKATDFNKNLCEILQVEYSEESDNGVELSEISQRNKRLELLRKFTADDDMLAKVNSVAFSDEDIAKLLEDGKEVIYLCGEKFIIPESKIAVTYIGVGNPLVAPPFSIARKNIVFKKMGFDLVNLTSWAKSMANPIDGFKLWIMILLMVSDKDKSVIQSFFQDTFEDCNISGSIVSVK